MILRLWLIKSTHRQIKCLKITIFTLKENFISNRKPFKRSFWRKIDTEKLVLFRDYAGARWFFQITTGNFHVGAT